MTEPEEAAEIGPASGPQIGWICTRPFARTGTRIHHLPYIVYLVKLLLLDFSTHFVGLLF